jgi:hypothetical protein
MRKIPQFANEREEAEFWATHDATEFLDETASVDEVFVDARPSKKQNKLEATNESTQNS